MLDESDGSDWSERSDESDLSDLSELSELSELSDWSERSERSEPSEAQLPFILLCSAIEAGAAVAVHEVLHAGVVIAELNEEADSISLGSARRDSTAIDHLTVSNGHGAIVGSVLQGA